MGQLGLDKTAEEFRVLHQERQMAIAKWQEATDLIIKRDEELQAIYNEVPVNPVENSMLLEQCLQHFSFFITYEWAQ